MREMKKYLVMSDLEVKKQYITNSLEKAKEERKLAKKMFGEKCYILKVISLKGK